MYTDRPSRGARLARMPGGLFCQPSQDKARNFDMAYVSKSADPAPRIIDLDSARVATRRWFLALAMADFREAGDSLEEALQLGDIGERRLQSRAVQLAAVFYARPFLGCLTPSGRSSVRLPARFLDALDVVHAGVHAHTMRMRHRFVTHAELADCRIELCASSDHAGMHFGAVAVREPPDRSDLEHLAVIVDRFIALVEADLALIFTRLDPQVVSLLGTAIVPEPDDRD